MDPISIQEFAFIVGVSERTVYTWINTGFITYDKVTRKCDREEALRLFLKTELLYTPEDVAQKLFVSTATVYRAIKDGRLPIIKRFRSYYIDPDIMLQNKDAILRLDNNYARGQRSRTVDVIYLINEAPTTPSAFKVAFLVSMRQALTRQFDMRYDADNPKIYYFPFSTSPYTQSFIFKSLTPKTYHRYKKIWCDRYTLIEFETFNRRHKGVMLIDGKKYEIQGRKST